MAKKTEKQSDMPSISAILVGIYLIASLLSFINGISEGDAPRLFNDCLDPWKKIEYVMPAFRAGCWLGSPLGQDFSLD